jgi:hypothetical protein
MEDDAQDGTETADAAGETLAGETADGADGSAAGEGADPALLAGYLALVRQQPGVVAALIGGDTRAAIDASVPPAQAAYAAVRAAILAEASQAIAPGHGAGGPATPPTWGEATLRAAVTRQR